ncbi:MAG: hypothetical protein IKH15_09305 [Bacteroidales bacterium]|nr:hypothetical protein [Bacteroidales bacterium]
MQLFDIVNIFTTFTFIAFVLLFIAKLIIHFLILKPLITIKMNETEVDPDFDYKKYIDTDYWE